MIGSRNLKDLINKSDLVWQSWLYSRPNSVVLIFKVTLRVKETLPKVFGIGLVLVLVYGFLFLRL